MAGSTTDHQGLEPYSSSIRRTSNHSAFERLTSILPPSPFTYSSQTQQTLPNTSITTIICVLLASAYSVLWRLSGPQDISPQEDHRLPAVSWLWERSPIMVLRLQMNFGLSLPSVVTSKKSTVRHWALKYTVLPDHWEPKQAQIFHDGVYSMPREGKKGDIKKFGFVIGLRAIDMLNDLLILALDTEAMEGSCLSDLISILQIRL